MVPPPMIREFFTAFGFKPICSKNLAVFSSDPTMERISLSWRMKEPLGIKTSPSRSTAQIRISVFRRLTTSMMDFPPNPIDGFSRNRSSSTRPLAKVSILMAEGNFKSFKISLAAVSSGLIIMEIPNCSLIKRISWLYMGLRTLAMVWQCPDFFAIRQQRRFSSSAPVTAINKSAVSTPASC